MSEDHNLNLFKTSYEMSNVIRNREFEILPLRGPLNQKMEESASHHLLSIAFAPRRAEDNENAAPSILMAAISYNKF